MSWVGKIEAALNPAREITITDERDFAPMGGRHRPAAVLIPITDRPEPGVILTQRPDWLRSHAGQVAFPGGKIDDGDADPIDAALREAEEELGLPRKEVRIIGTADTYFSGSGYEIVPVVGIIPPNLTFTPNPGEVVDWFEVPLSFLLDANNAEKKQVDWGGQRREYYDMQWGERRIWGVTAGIIANLAARLA